MIAFCVLVLGKLFLPHFCADEVIAVQMLLEREATIHEYWAHWKGLWKTAKPAQRSS